MHHANHVRVCPKLSCIVGQEGRIACVWLHGHLPTSTPVDKAKVEMLVSRQCD